MFCKVNDSIFFLLDACLLIDNLSALRTIIKKNPWFVACISASENWCVYDNATCAAVRNQLEFGRLSCMCHRLSLNWILENMLLP